ncbi:MAG: hypothetical protein ACTSPY_06500 [Candidatus Helarchaeota archaeon]
MIEKPIITIANAIINEITKIFRLGEFPVIPVYNKIPDAVYPKAHKGHIWPRLIMLNISKLICQIKVRTPNIKIFKSLIIFTHLPLLLLGFFIK